MATDSPQRFVRQLKKGVLEMLVLRLLADKPCHGYELIVRLREKSQGLLELKEGTLYPILYRLEEEGCITSAWSHPDGTASPGRIPRRVYTVTEEGHAVLAQQQETWRRFAECVGHCLEGAPP